MASETKKPVKELDDLSAERLWLMFFKETFDRTHGIALVKELYRMHHQQDQSKSNPSAA